MMPSECPTLVNVIVRDSFIRNAYTIFDIRNTKIGFAKLA
jgi:hypothetical protein